MHCFSIDGKIKKYKSIGVILNEFYEFRLEAYQKRKLHLIKTLKEKIEIETSKSKFIFANITNKIKLHQMDDNKIIVELNKMKLYNKNGYDYLLNMSIRSMTKTKIKSLEELINQLKKQLSLLNRQSNKDLWIQDLKSI